MRTLTSVLGSPAYDAGGRRTGRVRDLVVDLGAGLDRAPVTAAVVGHRGGSRALVAWDRLTARADGGYDVADGPDREEPLASTEVLLRRDVLDGPVVLADPSRRTRVGDVVLEVDDDRARVVGLDLSAGGALRRLLRRRGADGVDAHPDAHPDAQGAGSTVPLSQVHLGSPGAHAAQLEVPEALVFRVGPDGLAEVLTRLSVPHARDVLEVTDPAVREEALGLLHPHVRSRVTGSSSPLRRTHRLAGWRVHRPRRSR